MSLLKLKMNNGETRLVKFDPKTRYEFNIERFDISTLTDGNAQWSIYDQSAAPSLTKDNDGLHVTFSSSSAACQLNLPIEQFNLTKKFAIEFSLTTELANFLYYGMSSASITFGSGVWWNNLGLWLYQPYDIVIYKGYHQQTWSGWQRYVGIAYTSPVSVVEICDPSDNSVEMRVNGEQVATFKLTTGFSTITFNNGAGEARGARMTLHSLKISYV